MNNQLEETNTEDKPIKVFTSYSQTDKDGVVDEEHKTWVRGLTERLRSDGFDAILDQTDLLEGHNAYQFMEQMVADPDVKKVILLIDLAYNKKATARTGGVGTESQIISPEIYESNGKQTKFIPVIRQRDENGNVVVPPFLRGAVYIDMSDDDKYQQNYEQLVRALADKRRHVPTPIGNKPSYLTE